MKFLELYEKIKKSDFNHDKGINSQNLTMFLKSTYPAIFSTQTKLDDFLSNLC